MFTFFLPPPPPPLSVFLALHRYTDVTELRALCTVLGPFGVKQLNDELMQRVSGQLSELKRLVRENREPLEVIKTKTDRVVTCTEAIKRLKSKMRTKQSSKQKSETSKNFPRRHSFFPFFKTFLHFIFPSTSPRCIVINFLYLFLPPPASTRH